jgi:hypothetical protein
MNIPEIVIAIFLKKIYAINMHEHDFSYVVCVTRNVSGNSFIKIQD